MKDSFVLPLNGVSSEHSAINTTSRTELPYGKTPKRRTNEKSCREYWHHVEDARAKVQNWCNSHQLGAEPQGYREEHGVVFGTT